jgi:hypothetical protein
MLMFRGVGRVRSEQYGSFSIYGDTVPFLTVRIKVSMTLNHAHPLLIDRLTGSALEEIAVLSLGPLLVTQSQVPIGWMYIDVSGYTGIDEEKDIRRPSSRHALKR